ncbi:MAG TPA: hypothetical protein VKU60_15975 [Chloroflexota bacterium]|nr:hypothetical protein [Chloroflexota bacterium]
MTPTILPIKQTNPLAHARMFGVVALAAALFGAVLLGANSVFVKLSNVSRNQVQVVQGTFGSTAAAQSTYQHQSSTVVLTPNS